MRVGRAVAAAAAVGKDEPKAGRARRTDGAEPVRVRPLVPAFFHAVAFFCALRVVPAVHCTDQIARDATDALESDALTDHAIMYSCVLHA